MELKWNTYIHAEYEHQNSIANILSQLGWFTMPLGWFSMFFHKKDLIPQKI